MMSKSVFERLYGLWLLLTDRELWAYILSPPAEDTRRWTAIWCRWRGHPNGVYYYNPGGFEPDMHCKGCHDDLE